MTEGIPVAGDRGEYLARLMASCEGYVRHVAIRTCRKFPHVRFEDVVEEGRYGLSLAAVRYDPGRGAKFITYAAWYVNVCVQKYVRREAARGFTFPHAGPIKLMLAHQDEVLDAHHRGRVRPGTGATDAADSAALFWAEVGRVLDPRERLILDRVYRHDETLKAAGDRLGVTRERARQLHDRALEKVKRRMHPRTFRLCAEASEEAE